MKKLIFIVFIVAAISFLVGTTTAFAFDEWTKKDTIYQLTYATLHIVDWGQTRYIAKNPDRFHEKNLVLGKHPSAAEVDVYFAATLVAHTGIAYILPTEYRRIWQCVWIGVEGGCVARNFRLGIKLDF